MLTGKWWLTPQGDFQLSGQEHWHFAAHVMLKFPADQRIPKTWFARGVPKEELEAALRRGADMRAVEFLSNSNSDARLFALREFGWVRTALNKFNVWQFDQETASLIRDSKDYWRAQSPDPGETIHVEEFVPKGQRDIKISVSALFGGGDPVALRGLSGAGPQRHGSSLWRLS